MRETSLTHFRKARCFYPESQILSGVLRERRILSAVLSGVLLKAAAQARTAPGSVIMYETARETARKVKLPQRSCHEPKCWLCQCKQHRAHYPSAEPPIFLCGGVSRVLLKLAACRTQIWDTALALSAVWVGGRVCVPAQRHLRLCLVAEENDLPSSVTHFLLLTNYPPTPGFFMKVLANPNIKAKQVSHGLSSESPHTPAGAQKVACSWCGVAFRYACTMHLPSWRSLSHDALCLEGKLCFAYKGPVL